uniref:Probable magnesium transporter n=2 Tax=Aegilops tauschii subsp. strangulata TaxID=200361 RepID=A0A452ZJH0_AEGTS
ACLLLFRLVSKSVRSIPSSSTLSCAIGQSARPPPHPRTRTQETKSYAPEPSKNPHPIPIPRPSRSVYRRRGSSQELRGGGAIRSGRRPRRNQSEEPAIAVMEGGMGGGGGQQELSADNVRGIVLALLSSGFIGSSFIIKKKGLRRAAVSSGISAGVGGHSYLLEPLWWVGMITMIVGEIANFVAYAFAPAVLVTPLGALSIIVSAVLAHFILNERLHALGVLGCVMCIAGSMVIVIHAPLEQEITSVKEIWHMATQPSFLLYVASVIVLVSVLVFHFSPLWGQSNVLIYTAICSLMGSLSVMSVKALGTSLKLTFEGTNQLAYPETWFFMLVVAICVLTQMNYLNKALDTFNTAVVSPIYYVMFTSLTILASIIMFKDWSGQSLGSITSEICGLIVVLSGTILLHVTKDYERIPQSRSLYAPLSPTSATRLNGELLRHVEEDARRTDDEEKVLRRQEMY